MNMTLNRMLSVPYRQKLVVIYPEGWLRQHSLRWYQPRQDW